MLLLEFNCFPSLSFDSHLTFSAHQGHLFSLLTLGFAASLSEDPRRDRQSSHCFCPFALVLNFLSSFPGESSFFLTNSRNVLPRGFQHLCLIWNEIFEGAGIPDQYKAGGQGCLELHKSSWQQGHLSGVLGGELLRNIWTLPFRGFGNNFLWILFIINGSNYRKNHSFPRNLFALWR